MTREQILARQKQLLEAARAEGRAMTAEELSEFDSLQRDLEDLDAREAAAPAADNTAERAIAAERERVADITALASSFDVDPSQAIRDGMTLDAFRAHVLEQVRAARQPVTTGVRVEADEEDKFREAASDGLALKGNINIRAVDGANNFRRMRLRDLAIECLVRDGANALDLMRLSNSEIYDEIGKRQFYNPTAAFPAIMDQTIRKSIVQMYSEVPTTFEQITSKGSLPDFKETPDHEYMYGGVGDFEEVPENGEIKPDMPETKLLPHRKLKTYGKQFSMTRQAFVNDDIGFLTRVPGLYAQRAKETIEKQVYDVLYNNPAIFDGKTFFHADHSNVMAAGSAPSQMSIQAMILKLQAQKDYWDRPIYMTPRQLIVPIGYEFDLNVIFRSAQVVGSSNNDINPLYDYPLTVVQTPRLNALAGTGACPWYLQASEASARGIQVDYLNGQEMPSTRRMETVGQLGFTWDFWLDWGVNVRDWRQFVKNPGVALPQD